jgi:hypothetical protein
LAARGGERSCAGRRRWHGAARFGMAPLPRSRSSSRSRLRTPAMPRIDRRCGSFHNNPRAGQKNPI